MRIRRTLADTGVFADLHELKPQPGVVRYAVNVPFWSAGGEKTRWFCVPGVTETIGFNRDGHWTCQQRTIWIKHFELELTNGVPASTRRIENRLFIQLSGEVYGVSDRWGESLTNATLIPVEGFKEECSLYD